MRLYFFLMMLTFFISFFIDAINFFVCIYLMSFDLKVCKKYDIGFWSHQRFVFVNLLNNLVSLFHQSHVFPIIHGGLLQFIFSLTTRLKGADGVTRESIYFILIASQWLLWFRPFSSSFCLLVREFYSIQVIFSLKWITGLFVKFRFYLMLFCLC